MPMAITAGRLDHLFTMQRPDPTQASGYADVAEVWGGIEVGLAATDESDRGGGPVALVGTTITLYHRTDLRASWRLIDQETETVYEVRQYGDPDGGRTWLRLMVVEIQ